MAAADGWRCYRGSVRFHLGVWVNLDCCVFERDKPLIYSDSLRNFAGMSVNGKLNRSWNPLYSHVSTLRKKNMSLYYFPILENLKKCLKKQIQKSCLSTGLKCFSWSCNLNTLLLTFWTNQEQLGFLHMRGYAFPWMQMWCFYLQVWLKQKWLIYCTSCSFSGHNLQHLEGSSLFYHTSYDTVTLLVYLYP